MHCTGMHALEIEPGIAWNARWVVASAVIACATGFLFARPLPPAAMLEAHLAGVADDVRPGFSPSVLAQA